MNDIFILTLKYTNFLHIIFFCANLMLFIDQCFSNVIIVTPLTDIWWILCVVDFRCQTNYLRKSLPRATNRAISVALQIQPAECHWVPGYIWARASLSVVLETWSHNRSPGHCWRLKTTALLPQLPDISTSRLSAPCLDFELWNTNITRWKVNSTDIFRKRTLSYYLHAVFFEENDFRNYFCTQCCIFKLIRH